VCFLATAAGDAESYIDSFYTAFRQLPCRPTHIPLFARTPDLKTVLLEQDIIYVGGGNTKSMLAVWRDWEMPELLRRAWEAGTVLAGVSAGAICWFETGLTDSSGTGLYPLTGLGFLAGACCPHYDGEAERPTGTASVDRARNDYGRARTRRWRGGALRQWHTREHCQLSTSSTRVQSGTRGSAGTRDHPEP
jgi:peptidase E